VPSPPSPIATAQPTTNTGQPMRVQPNPDITHAPPRQVTLEQMRALLDAAALDYDADRHGGLELVATYHTAAGVRHEVCINMHPELDWRVLDLGPDGSATFVDRLEGADDLRRQAVALAGDYAEQSRLHQQGVREDPPICNAKEMRMSYRARTRERAA
jgi:hypothetical protein